jgi:hypothetical protein
MVALEAVLLALIRGMVALALVSGGWLVGRAQTPAPDFTLSRDAPGGETTCTKGCVLQGGRDCGSERSGYMQTYWYRCGRTLRTNGDGANRCTATVNGWLKH